MTPQPLDRAAIVLDAARVEAMRELPDGSPEQVRARVWALLWEAAERVRVEMQGRG